MFLGRDIMLTTSVYDIQPKKRKTPHVGGSFSSKYQDIALNMILRVSSTVCSKVVEAIQS